MLLPSAAAKRLRWPSMPAALARLQVDVIELKSANMIGVPALRLLLGGDGHRHGERRRRRLPAVTRPLHASALWSMRSSASGHGLVMCMGKGGVGKTTIAASIAVALAHRGHQVHLTTTDPAAHVEETLHGAVEGLRVSRIDPVEATGSIATASWPPRGKNLDEAGRAALHEDLLSPCTEEVAVFGQFSRVISAARHEFVVVDTAPTGHTFLLIDAAGSYHRDIVRQMGSSAAFRTPMMMLQDPELDEGHPGHPARADPGHRGPRPAGRPRTRRHPSVGLGRQHVSGRRAPPVPVPAEPRSGRGRADRRRRVHWPTASLSCRC